MKIIIEEKNKVCRSFQVVGHILVLKYWTYSSSEIAFLSLMCLEKISKGVFFSEDVDLYIVLENMKNQYHCIFF